MLAVSPKLLTRDQFREAVFARDGHRCVFCGVTAERTEEGKLDAHDIIERRLWSDGGYYVDNGATVYEYDHLECESTLFSVEEVRKAEDLSSLRRTICDPSLRRTIRRSSTKE